ncbi:MAG: DUF1302 family protein [Ideonella sp.]|nr:DUF1302 family protein [Ideonella sp.]
MTRQRARLNTPLRRSAIAMAAALTAGAAQAVEIDTGNPDWALRFDNTIKGSLTYRLNDADAALVDSFRQIPTGAPPPAPSSFAFPQALNFNAGDDNFRNRGFVSERVDWLGEFDAVYRRSFGLRVSAAAWYDFAYHRSTDALDPTNGQSPYDEFADSTVDIAGQHIDLLDAFVFGGWDLGDGRKLTVRLGQFAQQWGESLFFGDNAVARAQGAIDIFKLLQSPNAQFKEILRPTPQIGAQLQITPTLSVGAYYQFKWIEDRLPPAGSYFSSANVPWGSSLPEAVDIPPPAPIAAHYLLLPGADVEASNSGQFGVQLKWRLQETDLGLYYAQFHDKAGQLYGDLNVFNPLASSWYYVFPEDIKVLGGSASRTFGDFNVALEGSVRDDMPLRSQNMLYPGAFAPAPQYATGRTAHVNLSTLATFGPSFIARESSVVAEIAWNRALSTDDPDNELDKGRTRDAAAMQVIFTPTYRQALSGVDLAVPMGVRYSLAGCSSVTVWDCKGNGFFTLGLEGNVNNAWQFALGYQQFFGSAVPFVDYSPLLAGGSAIFGQGNSLRDRSNLTFAMRYAF